MRIYDDDFTKISSEKYSLLQLSEIERVQNEIIKAVNSAILPAEMWPLSLKTSVYATYGS